MLWIILKLIDILLLGDSFLWKSVETSKGQYMFADDCKFQGNTIGVLQGAISHETCREKCLIRKKCTNITWKNQSGKKMLIYHWIL